MLLHVDTADAAVAAADVEHRALARRMPRLDRPCMLVRGGGRVGDRAGVQCGHVSSVM
jgi:hypothetical protein